MAELRQIFAGAAIMANMEEYDSQGNPVMPNSDFKKWPNDNLFQKCWLVTAAILMFIALSLKAINLRFTPNQSMPDHHCGIYD